MVLPVPDRPKNSATSPSPPILALQCIGSTPLSGRIQFITVKIDFLISPAYSVPAMMMIRCSNDSAMVVPLRTPSIAGIGLEMRRVQDDVVGLEICQLLGSRADEDVAREQCLPGAGGDETHPHAMRRIGAGVKVLGEQFLALQVGLHARLQHGELLRREAVVDLAPPDLAGDRGFVDDELVLRRATGVHAGRDHQRAIDRQLTFVAPQRPRRPGLARSG